MLKQKIINVFVSELISSKPELRIGVTTMTLLFKGGVNCKKKNKESEETEDSIIRINLNLQ